MWSLPAAVDGRSLVTSIPPYVVRPRTLRPVVPSMKSALFDVGDLIEDEVDSFRGRLVYHVVVVVFHHRPLRVKTIVSDDRAAGERSTRASTLFSKPIAHGVHNGRVETAHTAHAGVHRHFSPFLK